MNTDAAATLAASALLWIAQEPERFEGFIALTGADISSLRTQAQEPAFLGAVLDYVLSADENVLAFAETENIAPESVVSARAALPGGDVPHWT